MPTFDKLADWNPTAEFRAESLDEKLKPYLLAKAEFDKDFAEQMKQQEGIAKFDPYLNDNTPESRGISDNAKSMIDLGTDWLSNPFYHVNMNRLIESKKTYQNAMNELTGAAKNYEQFLAEQKDLDKKDNTRVHGWYDPNENYVSTPTLDHYLHNNNLDVYDMSGKEQFGIGSALGKSWSSRLSNSNATYTVEDARRANGSYVLNDKGERIPLMVIRSRTQDGFVLKVSMEDVMNWHRLTEEQKDAILGNQPELQDMRFLLDHNNDIADAYDRLLTDNSYLHLNEADQKKMRDYWKNGLLSGFGPYKEQANVSVNPLQTGTSTGRNRSGSGGLLANDQEISSSDVGTTRKDEDKRWQYMDENIVGAEADDDNPQGSVITEKQAQLEAAIKKVDVVTKPIIEQIKQKAAENPDFAKNFTHDMSVSMADYVADKFPLVRKLYGSAIPEQIIKNIEGDSNIPQEVVALLKNNEALARAFGEGQYDRGGIKKVLREYLSEHIDNDNYTDDDYRNMFTSLLDHNWFMKFVLDSKDKLGSYGLTPEQINDIQNSMDDAAREAGVSGYGDVMSRYYEEEAKSKSIQEDSKFIPGLRDDLTPDNRLLVKAKTKQNLERKMLAANRKGYDASSIAKSNVRDTWRSQAFDNIKPRLDAADAKKKNIKDAKLGTLNSGWFDLNTGEEILSTGDRKVNLNGSLVKLDDIMKHGKVFFSAMSPTGLLLDYNGYKIAVKSDNDLYDNLGQLFKDTIDVLEETNFNDNNTFDDSGNNTYTINGVTYDSIQAIADVLAGYNEHAQNELMKLKDASRETIQAKVKQLQEDYANTVRAFKAATKDKLINLGNKDSSEVYALHYYNKTMDGRETLTTMIFSADFRYYMSYNPLKPLEDGGAKLNEHERDFARYAINTLAIRGNFDFSMAADLTSKIDEEDMK